MGCGSGAGAVVLLGSTAGPRLASVPALPCRKASIPLRVATRDSCCCGIRPQMYFRVFSSQSWYQVCINVAFGLARGHADGGAFTLAINDFKSFSPAFALRIRRAPPEALIQAEAAPLPSRSATGAAAAEARFTPKTATDRPGVVPLTGDDSRTRDLRFAKLSANALLSALSVISTA